MYNLGLIFKALETTFGRKNTSNILANSIKHTIGFVNEVHSIKEESLRSKEYFTEKLNKIKR